eukprot:TRINITY_DN15797_c0_g1_i1.p1 TRINITY_DN15797_c0_g1~~TRINITY_DN15797_c0_g1_i1.p1  ORF type:complete len:117 (-),score=23.86 TRINITY_DN15797_c0_g1_i1:237-587(-)
MRKFYIYSVNMSPAVRLQPSDSVAAVMVTVLVTVLLTVVVMVVAGGDGGGGGGGGGGHYFDYFLALVIFLFWPSQNSCTCVLGIVYSLFHPVTWRMLGNLFVETSKSFYGWKSREL